MERAQRDIALPDRVKCHRHRENAYLNSTVANGADEWSIGAHRQRGAPPTLIEIAKKAHQGDFCSAKRSGMIDVQDRPRFWQGLHPQPSFLATNRGLTCELV